METAQSEGRRAVELHNLAAIIAFGYRVNSCQARKFRIWAPTNLREGAQKLETLGPGKGGEEP